MHAARARPMIASMTAPPADPAASTGPDGAADPEDPGFTDPGEAPDLDAILAMAEAARAGFPPPFAALAAEVRLRVEDWTDDATLDDLGIEDPYDLTGLYEGVPLTERSASDPPQEPGTVWIFRRPVLDEWAARGDVALSDLVAHVTVHEFAHHFGWSDDDIAAIDPWWE